MTKKTQRVVIVYPNSDTEIRHVPRGVDFQDRQGRIYKPAGVGDVLKIRVYGIDYHFALYQAGIPKPRPYWVLPSPGLSGRDLMNLEGEWIVNLLRRALMGTDKITAKDWLLIGLCGLSVGIGAINWWSLTH